MRPQLFNLLASPPTLAVEVAAYRASRREPVASGPVPGSGKTWNGKAWTGTSGTDMTVLTTPAVAGLGAQSGFIVDPRRTRREQAELRETVEAASPDVMVRGRRRL
ncbi:hypothetical protein [Burkholderia gladioli]|uniref:hypothetical protein n=2 Tax=Burkholderia TaxID=32008 RepID=UPI001640019A|nr:hypothetical protein [Burkholderia gladioli]